MKVKVQGCLFTHPVADLPPVLRAERHLARSGRRGEVAKGGREPELLGQRQGAGDAASVQDLGGGDQGLELLGGVIVERVGLLLQRHLRAVGVDPAVQRQVVGPRSLEGRNRKVLVSQ